MLSSRNADMYVCTGMFSLFHLPFLFWHAVSLAQDTVQPLVQLVLTLAHNSATAINLEGVGVKTTGEMQGSFPMIKCPFKFSRYFFIHHQNKDIKFEAQLVTAHLTQGPICFVCVEFGFVVGLLFLPLVF